MENASTASSSTELETPIDRVEVSILKGTRFYFENEGNEICFWASNATGKEHVSFNQHIESEKRNLTSTSTYHQFSINDDTYEIEFGMRKWMMELHCTLIKNGVHENTLVYSQLNKVNRKKFFRDLTLFFVLGLAGGYFSTHYFLGA